MRYHKNIFVFELLWLMFIVASCRQTSKDEQKSTSLDIQIPEKFQVLGHIHAYSLGSKPDKTISFRKQHTFGDTPNIFLGTILAFTVDAYNRVYIASKSSIKVFAPDGHYLSTIGRRGHGPGEFANFGALIPKTAYKKLFVYDDLQSLVNVYDLDRMKFTYSIPISPLNWEHIPSLRGHVFKDYYIVNDSLILAGFQNLVSNRETQVSTYYLMNRNGKIVSHKIIERKNHNFYNGVGIPGPQLKSTRPLFLNASTRNSLLTVDNEGSIYTAWTQNFFIKEYYRKGKYLQAIYYPYKNSRLDKNKLINSYKGNAVFLRKARHADLPDTWPALNYFFVDDNNRIWVSTIANSDNYYKWWILNKEGKLIATFKWKGERYKRDRTPHNIRMVKNGFLYVFDINAKTKERSIIKYKILLKKNIK